MLILSFENSSMAQNMYLLMQQGRLLLRTARRRQQGPHQGSRQATLQTAAENCTQKAADCCKQGPHQGTKQATLQAADCCNKRPHQGQAALQAADCCK
ncbi:hypothetical protein P8452_14096 [Trifolium repens]|nr:hypothetical protein P8452_14096 [Trifolium repens]